MPPPDSPKTRAQCVFSRVQRQRDDREPGHHRAADGPSPGGGLRGDHRQRRERRCHRADRGRTGADVPGSAGRAPREQPRVRRRAAQRLRGGNPRLGVLHRRRRPVRSGRNGPAVGAARRRRRRQRLQDQPIRPVAPDHHRPHLPPYGEDPLRAARARRRLRFPAAAAFGVRQGQARKEQRRDLPGDDEEDPGRRVSDQRGARAPLPPGLRPVAVLQLPAAVQDGDRRGQVVAGARRPRRTPSRHAASADAAAAPRTGGDR